LERELADAKNEKGRLLGLLEQEALAAPSKTSRALLWDRLFGAGVMSKYDDRARELMVEVGSNEAQKTVDWDGPSSAEARLATVHLRQDIVMLVSHIGDLNTQVQTVRRLLWAVVALLARSVSGVSL
jgi:hypothetical protein